MDEIHHAMICDGGTAKAAKGFHTGFDSGNAYTNKASKGSLTLLVWVADAIQPGLELQSGAAISRLSGTKQDR